jgi:hypothetical protein
MSKGLQARISRLETEINLYRAVANYTNPLVNEELMSALSSVVRAKTAAASPHQTNRAEADLLEAHQHYFSAQKA